MTKANSILAVHPGALGDLVLFGRLLERLDGPVTLAAGKEKAKLLAGLGVVKRTVDFDGLPMHEIFSDKPMAECILPGRLGRHDRLISCFASGDRTTELRLAALCGASDAAFLPVRPPAGAAGHLLAIWCDLFGLPFSPKAKAWKAPRPWKDAAADALRQAGVETGLATAKRSEAGQKFLAIHPGSGGVAKCWPLERFLELTKRVAPRLPAVFIVGPAERDRWGREKIEKIAREFPLLQSPPLTTLAGVLALAAGYVGNDSGVTHLSAAVGVRSVAIFGPSGAEHFSPIGPAVRIISAPLADLAAERVLAAVRETIA